MEIHHGSLSSMLLLPDMTVIIQRFNEIWSSIKIIIKAAGEANIGSVAIPLLGAGHVYVRLFNLLRAK